LVCEKDNAKDKMNCFYLKEEIMKL